MVTLLTISKVLLILLFKSIFKLINYSIRFVDSQVIFLYTLPRGIINRYRRSNYSKPISLYLNEQIFNFNLININVDRV